MAAVGVESARLEARLLIEYVTGCRHAELLMHPEQVLGAEAQGRFDELLARRLSGEPVSYLLGKAEFFGRVFLVSPAVLIPRPETEILVDLALQALERENERRVVDLGTGSGVIAVSLALACPQAAVMAVDLSGEALEIARANAARFGALVNFCAGDWFAPLAGERFDLIVSNPPYIADGDPHLARDGLPCEPQMALTAGYDGLDCIRRIVGEAPMHLNPGGRLLFEHGYDQGAACRNLLASAGFKEVFTHPDLAGIDRVSGGYL